MSLRPLLSSSTPWKAAFRSAIHTLVSEGILASTAPVAIMRTKPTTSNAKPYDVTPTLTMLGVYPVTCFIVAWAHLEILQ